jgi:hypothetical protein
VTAGSEQFPFIVRDPNLGAGSLAPFVSITLVAAQSIMASGLLDTGSTVNVLPYGVGERLGAVWEQQTTEITLSGNLAACEARALVVSAVIGSFLRFGSCSPGPRRMRCPCCWVRSTSSWNSTSVSIDRGPCSRYDKKRPQFRSGRAVQRSVGNAPIR